jgi:hypothetical protein
MWATMVPACRRLDCCVLVTEIDAMFRRSPARLATFGGNNSLCLQILPQSHPFTSESENLIPPVASGQQERLKGPNSGNPVRFPTKVCRAGGAIVAQAWQRDVLII